MKRTLCFGSIVFIMCVSLGACGATWYVDGSTPEFGDGSSWETPLETIQEGIDAASDGHTVIVAEGTYNENIRFKGKNIVLRSKDPTSPIVVKNTIIDGTQAGSVVTFAGTEDETCVLSGFTIRNGTGTEVLLDSTPARVGGESSVGSQPPFTPTPRSRITSSLATRPMAAAGWLFAIG